VGDHYLWDRSGKPDPEIVWLEEVLRPLRWRETDRWPRRVAGKDGHGCGRWLRSTHFEHCSRRAEDVDGGADDVSAAVGWGWKASAIRAGQVIETQAAERATVKSELVGRIEVEPPGRVYSSRRLEAVFSSLPWIVGRFMP
jgi:hypothetical protein